MTGRTDAPFPALLTCFFLSGFSALVYETAWTRELAFVFGTSDLAVAAVLAAYMGGLATGAAVAARAAPRLRRPVLVYGLLELGIALGALAVPLGVRALTALYVAAFGGREIASEAGGLVVLFRLAGAFALLLPPTALMGATLPLLARHSVRRDEQVGPRVGALYAMNTAGAIVGTLSAAFVLLPALGLRHTVYGGALVNALVFGVAAWLARSAPLRPADATSEPERGGRWILPLIALSGAVSFAYEVLWTRLLSQILGGSVYAFATMLASFLLGIALGSALAGRLAREGARATTAFAWSQLGIAALSLVAFAATDAVPLAATLLGAGAEAGLIANAALAGAVLLPFAVCIGATFPLAVRILAPDARASSSATARVYAWNTLGAIAGSIGAGFVLLPRLGFVGTLSLGCAVNVGLAAVAALRARPRAQLPLAAAVAVAVLIALQPIGPPWRLLRASPFEATAAVGRVEFFAVGRSSTVMVVDDGSEWRLYTNGLPEAIIQRPGANPGRFVEARWLGFLPVLLRPETRRVLVIGLGGGSAIEGLPSTVSSVDVVELEPEVVAANRKLSPAREIDPLASTRVRVLVNDARGALLLSRDHYDAIISQPSHPWTAGASHLYTREFFELAKAHLEPDGVFVQWIGVRFVDAELLRTLVATLLDVFPHVSVFRPVPMAILFAASNAPIDLPASARAALDSAASADLARYGIELPEDVAAALMLDTQGARAFARGATLSSDDHNLLAMRSARIGAAHALNPRALGDLVADLDPLAALAPRLDPVLLVRRLLRPGGNARRAEALARTLDTPERELALGWVEVARNRWQAAAFHFESALAHASESQTLEARAGLFILARAGADGGETSPLPILAPLMRARAFTAESDWKSIAADDALLAGLGPESPLFELASRARIGWRLASRDPQRADEALQIIDRSIARGARVDDYLLRAEAALAAGRADAAWAALGQIARSLRPEPRAAAIARRALAIVSALPDGPAANLVRPRLARLAR